MPLRVDNKTQLIIEGTTNINSFSCETYFESGLTPVKATSVSKNKLNFGAKISFRVESIDCKQEQMNRDLHKTLKSDQYPNINIELISIDLEENGKDLKGSGLMNIEVGGVNKPFRIAIQKVLRTENLIAFEGEKTLSMRVFDLDPPKAMFGLIKVNEQINIKFHLRLVRLD